MINVRKIFFYVSLQEFYNFKPMFKFLSHFHWFLCMATNQANFNFCICSFPNINGCREVSFSIALYTHSWGRIVGFMWLGLPLGFLACCNVALFYICFVLVSCCFGCFNFSRSLEIKKRAPFSHSFLLLSFPPSPSLSLSISVSHHLPTLISVSFSYPSPTPSPSLLLLLLFLLLLFLLGIKSYQLR